MNNMIVKLGIRLFLFCMVAAIALAITNEITKGPIAEQALASKMAALRTVMPGCTYEQAELGELEADSELDELYIARDSDGNIAGYAITASPNGYGGEIPITFGVSTAGHVTQVYVGSLQETAGLGSKVGESAFKDQFIGIAADDTTLRNDVDTISGASVSSGAFLRAAEDALAYAKNVLNITPAAGNKEEILAAFNAANGGEVGAAQNVPVETHTVTVKGFDTFDVDVDVDADGKIVSVVVPSNNETPDIGGALISDNAVFEALSGQDIATAQIDVRAGATLTSNAINEALSKVAAEISGSTGAKVYDVTGIAPFKVAVELDADGKILSVTVPEHGETSGYGADLIADTAVFDALVGQDIATAQIEVKSGATLTSNAINDALAQAAKDFAGDSAPVTVPGDPYTVKGLNKFTIYIELEGDKIASVTVPHHEETPEFGGALLTEEALSALVGKSVSEAKVDTVSGSTLTSDALNTALGMAALANGYTPAVTETKAEEPKAEEPAAEEAKAEEPVTEESEGTEPEGETSEPVTVANNVTKVDVKGYNEFTVEIGLDEAGKITSFEIPANEETAGLGAALIEDKAVFEALIGQDVATARIDVRTGATLTSDAINEALSKAAAVNGFGAENVEETPETEETKPETAEPEKATGKVTKVEVTGYMPFTVEIGLDEAGKITSFEIPANEETAGLGAALIEDKAVFEALIGQDVATARIDVRTGATLTSDAINEALSKAAAVNGFGAENVEETPETEETKPETAEPEKATGKVTKVEVTGYMPFTVEIGLDEAGKITSFEIPSHEETAGLGAALIEDKAVFEALIGQDVATAQIDVRAGATLTSNAINEALSKAAAVNGFGAEKAEEAPEAEEPKPETAEPEKATGKITKVEVTGYMPFTVEIGLDEAGKITSFEIPSHEETAGLGAALIEDKAVFEALIGQDVATAQIDVRTNATLTSNAINEALAKAASENGFAAESAEEEVATASEAQNTASAKKVVKADVTGLQAFTVEIAVDDAGKILRVEIPEHNETPGYGADLIEDKAVFEALAGQDIADAQIDVRSGATLTSNAINDALKKAAEEVGK